MFPPHCPLCGEDTSKANSLCGACWPRIEHLTPPFCDLCSEPYPMPDSGYSGPLVCGDCVAKPPPYQRLRSALVYNEEARRLLILFKHSGHDGLAKLFQPWMQRVAAPLLRQVDLVVPVPIHWTRLWKRSFNQSAILANHLDLNPNPDPGAGAALLLDALVRTRRTPPQGRSKFARRAKNLKGAISANPKHRDAIKRKRVLLIDDVAASGSTLGACTRALKRAGAAEVSCLVLAKPLRRPV